LLIADLQIVLLEPFVDHTGCKLALIGRADRISSLIGEELLVIRVFSSAAITSWWL
jgi:hypothetical protein